MGGIVPTHSILQLLEVLYNFVYLWLIFMDNFLTSLLDPESLIWSTDIPLLDIDLAGIEPVDYIEYIVLLIEALREL